MGVVSLSYIVDTIVNQMFWSSVSYTHSRVSCTMVPKSLVSYNHLFILPCCGCLWWTPSVPKGGSLMRRESHTYLWYEEGHLQCS